MDEIVSGSENKLTVGCLPSAPRRADGGFHIPMVLVVPKRHHQQIITKLNQLNLVVKACVPHGAPAFIAPTGTSGIGGKLLPMANVLMGAISFHLGTKSVDSLEVNTEPQPYHCEPKGGIGSQFKLSGSQFLGYQLHHVTSRNLAWGNVIVAQPSFVIVANATRLGDNSTRKVGKNCESLHEWAIQNYSDLIHNSEARVIHNSRPAYTCLADNSWDLDGNSKAMMDDNAVAKRQDCQDATKFRGKVTISYRQPFHFVKKYQFTGWLCRQYRGLA